MKNKRKVLFSVVGIVFILILIGSYINNYSLLSEAPSKTWSKEVEIGTGRGKNSPVIIKEEDRLLTAYEDVGKLRICETDLNAKVIKTVDYEIEEELLKNMMFSKNANGYTLMYNSSKSGQGYMEKILVDKDLNLINRAVVEGIESTYQVDDSNIVSLYEDKLEVLNTVKNTSVTVPTTKVSVLTASASKDGIQVCYLENEDDINTFTVKDGIASEPFLVATMSKSDKITYNNMSSSSDGINGYILIEEYVRNEYSATKLIEFPITGGETKISTLSVNNSKYVINTKGAYSEDGGVFYATMSTAFGKKEVKKSIVSFVVKDGKASNVEVVTRLRDLCIHPYITDGYSAFLSFKEKDTYDINISSSNESFKNVNNVSRGTEKTMALSYTVEGIMESISYIIILGFRWILPVLFIGGIVTFLDYAFSEKKKKIVYVILAAIAIGMKSYTVINMFYGTYASMLPNAIAHIGVGIAICLLIGIIVYTYGYFVYIDDLEGIFIGRFGLFVLLDAILTLMIFVPLIA
ncbi:MAG: hypothetical protein RR636_13070 [Clostridium sp.]|uniref:hypothetical protein n=1 Tax=Clostridium sp. TaxID=1506 RepID=UPI00303D9118